MDYWRSIWSVCVILLSIPGRKSARNYEWLPYQYIFMRKMIVNGIVNFIIHKYIRARMDLE